MDTAIRRWRDRTLGALKIVGVCFGGLILLVIAVDQVQSGADASRRQQCVDAGGIVMEAGTICSMPETDLVTGETYFQDYRLP